MRVTYPMPAIGHPQDSWSMPQLSEFFSRTNVHDIPNKLVLTSLKRRLLGFVHFQSQIKLHAHANAMFTIAPTSTKRRISRPSCGMRRFTSLRPFRTRGRHRWSPPDTQTPSLIATLSHPIEKSDSSHQQLEFSFEALTTLCVGILLRSRLGHFLDGITRLLECHDGDLVIGVQ